jgi:D-alanyl-lipoteichoic acid acyltransferase DltB (MBOAT superfamily)
LVFDSLSFLVFFAAFLVAHHALYRWVRAQNALIVLGSAVFYGWWDVRFLGLLFLSAGIDYLAGVLLGRLPLDDRRRRRWVLALSMSSNLAILFIFKYFDFFVDSLAAVLGALGVHAGLPTLRVVLPVGISFYTFQSMSYTIDVYRGEAEPERDPIVYFAFVSFFPHMVAGPIQRAHHLITQLHRPRVITGDHVREAVWLLCWGYFLKVVIANSAAPFVDVAFRTDQTSGWSTVLGTLAFAIQIYCDFNGYSLIARGLGRLLGIEFIWNFNQPYAATSIQDFWRRWHISLSTWLRDYLYVPLGGNRKGVRRTYVNLILTMLLGGLWHGAAWNFVLWGLLHGVALAAQKAWTSRERRREMPAALGWALTMLVVLIGWFLFRCRSWDMVRNMTAALGDLSWTAHHTHMLTSLASLALPVVLVELWQLRRKDLLAPAALPRGPSAALAGVLLTLTIAMFGLFNYAFIYFQF